MKACSKCGAEKPFSDFHKDSRKATGYRSACRECLNGQYREHYQANPDKMRLKNARVLCKKYGLSLDDYLSLTSRGCDSCGDTDRPICIDHDHDCCPGDTSCGNCIRGALCTPCNLAEGYLRSDPDRALALAAYMLKSKNLLEIEV